MIFIFRVGAVKESYMAEQTFRSPGFFDREIDLSEQQQAPVGVPGGVIGTSIRGPAFVPVVVGSFADFQKRFGTLDPDRFGPYAVDLFLKNRTALTYMRVLGAGANNTAAQINTTDTQGTVVNAGFTLTGSVGVTPSQRPGCANGVVQFICARQYVSSGLETVGFPVFSDNDSFPSSVSGDDSANLLRAVLFTSTGSIFQVRNWNTEWALIPAGGGSDGCNITDTILAAAERMPNKVFKLYLSNSAMGGEWTMPDSGGTRGVKVITASLDPTSQYYLDKVLNTDPQKFRAEKHLLYAHFPVDEVVASVPTAGDTVDGDNAVIMTSGTMYTSPNSGDTTLTYVDAFGRYDTRYTTPRTTWFISQPMGNIEHDLFYFETISDGAVTNASYKVSIANILASVDDQYGYGSFEVQVRKFKDTDANRQIIERYPNCNLDPNSDRFIGRVIGDMKAKFNFDAEDLEERRVVVTGRHPNQSSHIRVQFSDAMYSKDLPASALPFGFRGIPTLKTSTTLTDEQLQTITINGQEIACAGFLEDVVGRGNIRMGTALVGTDTAHAKTDITSSIVPPMPYRFKLTNGMVASAGTWVGQIGDDERIDSRYYWGVMNTSVSPTGTFGAGQNEILRPNEGTAINGIVEAYTKFMGISKLDVLVTGSGKDAFNNNKFTLAKVALPNTLGAAGHISELTGTVRQHMKGAAYFRNGRPNSTTGLMPDAGFTNVSATYPGRITFATLVGSSSIQFNRFTQFTKYTNVFYGGFDGLNILDNDQYLMNDRATSIRAGGGYAATDATNFDLSTQTNGTGNPAGTLLNNSLIRAYRQAVKIMTDVDMTNINILAIPGIRDPLVVDYAGDRCRDNGQIFHVMDLEPYDENQARLYRGRSNPDRPDVGVTSRRLESRNLDNNYSATYFPDVYIEDEVNRKHVNVPVSVVVMSALGFNDKNARPWFAPAGFNRGSLNMVKNVSVRLSTADRDTLYDARINPIAIFPNGGAKSTFVIFGQKNLQLAKSALDRINVRRMLLEVKRLIVTVARNLIFEQNTPALRGRFISAAAPLLSLVQAQQGIENFRIIMDDSNNTFDDIQNYRLNGRIIVVPTRAVEFIAIDFIVDPLGVTFT